MKKTISATIKGIIFHLEEDAFQQLNAYLESLRRHYATVEEGGEILSDIEIRIAELFTAILGGSRQVVQLSDVESVMRQVGTVEAIAAEAGEEEGAPPLQSTAASDGNSNFNQAGQQKRLYRDLDQSIIGGVCSGIAAWFGVNPLWIRLGFAGFFFGAIPFLPELAGPVFLAYLVLWIAVPGRKGIQNPGSFRRFYLSNRDKVLAGVCGGVGRYFNIDPALVRILFVLGLFLGGGGILLYIVLWIITPEASSLTDEIRMDGQQVNLKTLEEQVKKRIEPDASRTESWFTKLLLFPFRLLGMLIEAIKPLLQLTVDLTRIFTGLLFIFLGLVLLFVFGVVTAVCLGYISNASGLIEFGDFPVNRIANELSPWLVGTASLSVMIPSFLLLMLGIGLMVKRKVLSRVLVISLAGLFFISSMAAFVLVVPKIKAFEKEGHVVKTIQFQPKGKVLLLQVNQVTGNQSEENIFPHSLRIVYYNGDKVILRQRFNARGKTRSDAVENAGSASLQVVQVDSILIFDPELRVDPAFPFRVQSLEMTLYLPQGTRFKMEGELYSILKNPEGEFHSYEAEEGEKVEYADPVDFEEDKIWILRDGCLISAPETDVYPDSSGKSSFQNP